MFLLEKTTENLNTPKQLEEVEQSKAVYKTSVLCIYSSGEKRGGEGRGDIAKIKKNFNFVDDGIKFRSFDITIT